MVSFKQLKTHDKILIFSYLGISIAYAMIVLMKFDDMKSGKGH